MLTQGAQPSALQQPRGVGWGWEGGSGEKGHVYLRLIHTVEWQKATQHCKAIILQLKIKYIYIYIERERLIPPKKKLSKIQVKKAKCNSYCYPDIVSF